MAESGQDPSYAQLTETAVEAARLGGDVLLHYFRSTDLEVRHKGEQDFVTQADHESEAKVLGLIQGRHPDHHVVAEESGFSAGHGGGGVGGPDGFSWFVDPLDGTSNFLQGLPMFCVSVACCHGDDVVAAAVLDPLRDSLFTASKGGGASWNGQPMRVSKRPSLDGAFLATGYPFKAHRALDLYLQVFREIFLQARGIRRCGSAALDLAFTAAGVYDGFFEFRLSPWDFAAGVLLIREAGGVITDLDGGEGFFSGGNLLAGPPGVHRQLVSTVGQHVSEAVLDSVEPRRNNPTSAVVE